MHNTNYVNINFLKRRAGLAIVLALIPLNMAHAAPDMALRDIQRPMGNGYRQVSMVTPYKIVPPMPVRKPGQRIATQKISAMGIPQNPAIITAPLSNNHFDAGIAAYRRGDQRSALKLFVNVTDHTKNNEFERAAGAFWAARVADQMGQPKEAQKLRQMAAHYPHTFYGQIATAQLGQTTPLNWARPDPSLLSLTDIENHPQGPVLQDHLTNGRLSAADQTLLQMSKGADADFRAAILTFAIHHELPATALKLARTVERDTGHRFDAAYYPVGGWMKAADFRVDRALVHAIVRQESAFNPQARSNMGAVGLMQVLPSTASYVVKVRAGGRMDTSDLTPARRNLDVGQHYVQYLMNYKGIDGDVINTLVAYNAGPGNLMKWQKNYADTVHDPLLFIETIPSSETRAYVEKVMSAYWIYRARFGQTNPTLVSIAAGQPASITASKSSPTWFAGFKLNRYVKM